MASAIHSVESSGVGRWMRESLWAYPGVEIAHLVGIGLLFGSIVVVDLRLLGLGRGVPVTRLVAHAVPWSLAGFLLALCSGLLMFSAHAADFLDNRTFALKMGLILAGGINAAWLHSGPYTRATAWDVNVAPPPSVRCAGALSIVLWIGVIACGRLLAYT
jgi:hypothetical protein